MRQMAYLDAYPETETKSRRQRMAEQDVEIPLPGLTGGGYMVDALQEAGVGNASGEPLSWLDVYSYSICTGNLTETWERRLLKELSAAYCDELAAAKDRFRIPPMDR